MRLLKPTPRDGTIEIIPPKEDLARTLAKLTPRGNLPLPRNGSNENIMKSLLGTLNASSQEKYAIVPRYIWDGEAGLPDMRAWPRDWIVYTWGQGKKIALHLSFYDEKINMNKAREDLVTTLSNVAFAHHIPRLQRNGMAGDVECAPILAQALHELFMVKLGFTDKCDWNRMYITPLPTPFWQDESHSFRSAILSQEMYIWCRRYPSVHTREFKEAPFNRVAELAIDELNNLRKALLPHRQDIFTLDSWGSRQTIVTNTISKAGGDPDENGMVSASVGSLTDIYMQAVKDVVKEESTNDRQQKSLLSLLEQAKPIRFNP